jgi:hypothetical protein
MSGIFCVRLAFVLLCSFGLYRIARAHEQVVRGLREFFFEPTAPENLALLRLVVFAAVLVAAVKSAAPWYAHLPLEYRELPRGWPWLENDVLSFLTPRMELLRWLLVGSSALAFVGAFSRVSMPVATVLAVFVLGVPNFYFKISHGMHVQVLCAAVLSVSRAGDAVSIDALVRRFRGRAPFAPHVAYAIPIRFSWLLLGTMYLFPGLWKLWESGDLWMLGIKVRLVLLDKWSETYAALPHLRIDQSPMLLALFGMGTLVLEIGFSCALFRRKTRVIAGLLAASFHIGIGLSMDIWFDFWWPLIVLLEFPEVLRVFRVGPLAARIDAGKERQWPLGPVTAPNAILPRDSGASAFVVGAALLFAMSVAGLAPVDSWPIAVYPRFDSRPDHMPMVGQLFEYWAKTPSGQFIELEPNFAPIEDSAAVARIIRKALELRQRGDGPASNRRLRFLGDLVRSNSRTPIPQGSRLVVYLVWFPLDPALRTSVAKGRQLVDEVDF